MFIYYTSNTLAILSSHIDIAHEHQPLALMARMIHPASARDPSASYHPKYSHKSPQTAPRHSLPQSPDNRQNPRKNAPETAKNKPLRSARSLQTLHQSLHQRENVNKV